MISHGCHTIWNNVYFTKQLDIYIYLILSPYIYNIYTNTAVYSIVISNSLPI